MPTSLIEYRQDKRLREYHTEFSPHYPLTIELKAPTYITSHHSTYKLVQTNAKIFAYVDLKNGNRLIEPMSLESLLARTIEQHDTHYKVATKRDIQQAYILLAHTA